MPEIAYKVVLLLRRRPELAPDDFTRRWLELDSTHPADTPGLIRRTFQRPLARDANAAMGPSPTLYDGAEEYWFEKKVHAANWFVSHAFADQWLPSHQELLSAKPDAVGGQPQTLWERSEDPDPDGSVTLLTLPVALRRLTTQQFVQQWSGSHAWLALGGRHKEERVLRLEHTPAASPPTPFGRTRFDGVGAMTFVSEEALMAELSSSYYLEKVLADERRFVDVAFSGSMLTTTTVPR